MAVSQAVIAANRNPVGAPSTYSDDIAELICAYLAEGKSMRTIATFEGMPCIKTMFTWMRVYPEFLQRYTRAKAESAESLAEEIIDIADDARNDWMEVEVKGQTITKLDREHVERSKLRIESRKWIAAKLLPKKYGERLDVTIDATISIDAALTAAKQRVIDSTATRCDDDAV